MSGKTQLPVRLTAIRPTPDDHEVANRKLAELAAKLKRQCDRIDVAQKRGLRTALRIGFLVEQVNQILEDRSAAQIVSLGDWLKKSRAGGLKVSTLRSYHRMYLFVKSANKELISKCRTISDIFRLMRDAGATRRRFVPPQGGGKEKGGQGRPGTGRIGLKASCDAIAQPNRL